jgi:NitT/TauT family transport system substrate-binding protein
MMGEVAKLLGDASGKLDMTLYERTAKALLDQKIIAKAPEGAYTTEITDAASK